MHLYFEFLIIASEVHIWGYLGGPWRCFFRNCSKKSFKTRPNSPYGGETLSYLLLQQGVLTKTKTLLMYFYTKKQQKKRVVNSPFVIGFTSKPCRICLKRRLWAEYQWSSQWGMCQRGWRRGSRDEMVDLFGFHSNINDFLLFLSHGNRYLAP